jgi:NhaP-type Na+/H+ or K+/H+ antiporter
MVGYGVVSHTFEVAAVAFGGLLICGALLSELMRRTVLSPAALFLAAGFVLGHGATDAIDLDASSGFVSELATVALVVILLRDGLEVDAELLRSHWHLPARKLVAAMPITAALVAVACKLLTGLTWTEAFLVGALLSPTDPVLSSSVVTNPRVPAIVRNSLNLESGLNDGLALPAVLALASVLSAGGHFDLWRFIGENLGFGFGVGLLVGLAASLAPARSIAYHQQALFGLGVAFVAYGVAVLLPNGNGLIAAFVTAIVLGIRRPDVREAFAGQSPDIVEIVKLGIFAVFGALLTVHGLSSQGWAGLAVAAATLLVARPVAVMCSLLRTSTDLATRGFMAWFGPKGVATITFSLLVLSERVQAANDIFDLAALTVVVSVVAHGVTDQLGSEWMAARAQRIAPVGGADPPAAAGPVAEPATRPAGDQA